MKILRDHKESQICAVFICILLVTDKSTRQKPGKSNALLSSFLGDKAVCFLSFEEGGKGSYFCPRGPFFPSGRNEETDKDGEKTQRLPHIWPLALSLI